MKPLFSPPLRIGDRTLVVVAGAATLFALVFLGMQMATITNGRVEGSADTARIQQLQLEVTRIDLRRMQSLVELLATGDADVARAYRETDAALSNALQQLAAEAITPQEEAAASAASLAYHTMATYESDAIALALSGRPRAGEALYSAEYSAARVAWAEAMVQAREALWPRLDPIDARIDRATLSTMVFGPIAAGLILALLALVLRRLSRLAGRVEKAETDLAVATAEIARREREAHANMIARCPAPAAEFEFAPALKLVAWLRKRGVEDLERWLKIYPGEIRKLAPQFGVLRVNRPAADLLKAADGGQLKELERWIPDRSLHQCVLAILRALWTRSSAVSATFDVRTLHGEERTMELRGTLISKGEGKAPTLMAVLTDVTDIAELKGELAALREASVKTAQNYEEFFTTTSRELRAALDGVTGMAAALERSRLDREQRDALSVIKDSGEAMRDTLDRARDYRRLEANDIEIANLPFDVGGVVQSVNSRYSPRAKAKGLRLRMSIDDAARVRLTGDENRVRQILSKLVANAIEFTPRGEVEARVAREQVEGHDMLVLTVRDTGGGLTAAEIQRAMEESGGSGGGLALCRRLCAAMGGRLDITSSSDYGTTVTARMRVDDAPKESPAGAADAETAGEGIAGRRLTLLAADDNAINRIVLNDMLEPMGVDLTLVDNGADAIAAWRARPFDAILLDIHMPVLSGHDVAREIRKIEAQEGRAPTPIIAVSASVMKSEVDACIEAGMNDHVPKPIELGKLKAAIAKAVAAAEAASEADGEAAA